MAKLITLRGPIREFTVAMGAYSRGGAYLQFVGLGWGLIRGGGLFRDGGPIRGFTVSVVKICTIKDLFCY